MIPILLALHFGQFIPEIEIQLRKLLKSSLLVLLSCLYTANFASAKNLTNFKLTPDVVFHADHFYEINLKKNREFSNKIRGSFLGWDGSDLIDRSVAPPRRYTLAQIESLREYTGRTKGRQTLKGLGIGTLVGGIFGAVAGSFSNDDCSDAGDVGDCEALNDAGPFLGAVVLGLVGAGVGTVVGTALPKKERIIYVP